MPDPAPRPDDADAAVIQRVRNEINLHGEDDAFTRDLHALCALAERNEQINVEWSERYETRQYELNAWLAECTAKREQAEARVAALEKALERYGRHDGGCPQDNKVTWVAECTCGLWAALTPRGDADRAGE